MFGYRIVKEEKLEKLRKTVEDSITEVRKWIKEILDETVACDEVKEYMLTKAEDCPVKVICDMCLRYKICEFGRTAYPINSTNVREKHMELKMLWLGVKHLHVIRTLAQKL